jgi:hypothetical protein
MVQENRPDNSQVETRQQMIERLGEKNKAYRVVSEGFNGDNEQLFPKKKVSFKIEPGKYFSKALTEAIYGEGKDFTKDLTSAQRNVILNVDLMMLHHGINTNVVKIGDEWNFDFGKGTFNATLGGKEVQGQLNLPERAQVVEKTTAELREEYVKTESGHSLADMLSDDEVDAIAEADQDLAEYRADQASRERLTTAETLDESRVTTQARREIFGDNTTVMETAIESGSLESVMESLQQMNLSYKQRRALIQSDELFVDDLITGMNHYLPADKAIESDGSNYAGTAEQNIAWTKVVKDVLGPGFPEYLELPVLKDVPKKTTTTTTSPEGEKINIEGLYEYATILERDWSKFLKRDFDFANVDISTAVDEEAGTVSYTIDITDKDGNPQILGGVISYKDKGTIEDQYELMVLRHGDFFDKHRGGAPEEEKSALQEALDAVPVGRQPDGRDEVEGLREGGGGDEAASIGPLQEMSGGPSGELEGLDPVVLTEPELPPVEKLEKTYDAEAEEEARKAKDKDRSQDSLKPVKDRDLTPEPLLGEPGSHSTIEDANELAGKGDIQEEPVSKRARPGSVEEPSAADVAVDHITGGGGDGAITEALEGLEDEPVTIESGGTAEEILEGESLPPAEAPVPTEKPVPVEEQEQQPKLRIGLKRSLKELRISPDYNFEDVTVQGIEFGPAKFKKLAQSGFAGQRKEAKQWQGHVLEFESKEKAESGGPRVRMEIQSKAYVHYWGAPKIRVWVEGKEKLNDYDSTRHDVMGELEKFSKDMDEGFPEESPDSEA